MNHWFPLKLAVIKLLFLRGVRKGGGGWLISHNISKTWDALGVSLPDQMAQRGILSCWKTHRIIPENNPSNKTRLFPVGKTLRWGGVGIHSPSIPLHRIPWEPTVPSFLGLNLHLFHF